MARKAREAGSIRPDLPKGRSLTKSLDVSVKCFKLVASQTIREFTGKMGSDHKGNRAEVPKIPSGGGAISGRGDAEEAIRRSEERYRTFIKLSSEGIWRFELDKPIPVDLPADEQVKLAYQRGYLAECNDAMARQYGFTSAEEITGARLADLLVKDDPKNYEFVKAFVESGYNLSEAESHERDADGNDRYFLNNFTGVVEDGKLVRAWGTQRDVTHAKLTEKATAHLAAIVTSSEDAIISKDLNGVITSWNKGAELVFGYTASEVLGKPITVLMPPERIDEAVEILERIKQGEKIDHFETVRRRKDDRDINISLSVSPIKDGRGKIIGAAKIARDISLEKKAHEIAERYRLLWMRARDIILFLETETGRIVEANQAAVETYGYDHRTLLKMHIGDLRAEETLPLLKGQYEAADKGGAQFETIHKRSDGSKFPVEVSAIGSDVGGGRLIISIIRDISERREAEDLLNQNQAMLALAMQSSKMGAWELDVETGIVQWTPELEEIFGLEIGSFGGTQTAFRELVYHDDRESINLVIENAVKNRREYVIEFRFIHADGSIRWMEGRGEAVYSQKGEPVRIYGIGIDITERKRAEIALRESDERFARFMQHLPGLAWIKDMQGRYVFVNDAAETAFRTTRDELYGRTDDEVFPPEIASQFKENDLLTIEERSAVQIVEALDQEDGIHHSIVSKFPIPGPDGEVKLVGGVAIDITERKRAEEALTESEERYRGIVDQTVGGIAETDLEGRFLIVNDRYCEIVGYSREELLDGMRMQEITHPADLSKNLEQFRKLVKHGTPFEIEKRYVRKDGSHVWVANSVSAVRDASGNVQSVVAIVIDVSTRKEAEEKLRESEERYRNLADAMPQLVWTAAPDGTIDYYNSLASQYEAIEHDGEPQPWNWQSILHPEDTGPATAAWQEAQTTGAYEFEHRMRMKDGSYRWHLSRALAIKSSVDQNIVKWFGTATDIHDHKIAQESLVKAERRAADEYRALLSRIVPLAQSLGTARDLISIYRSVQEFVCTSMRCTGFFVSFYNPETRFRTAAYAWGEQGEVEISTLPPIELAEDGGPNSRAVFERRPIVVNDFMDHMKDRPHLILQDDGINPSSSMVVPMIVMNRVIGTVEVQAYENDAFQHDHVVALEMVANLAAVAIENVRLIEIEAKARSEAEAANIMKDEFLSILSHELRTPLNAMLGWVRMLRGGMLDEERSAKALEVIERNTRQQSSLIEDLLDVSRIISGKMKIEKESVDLKTILTEVAESVRPLAMNKEVRFEFHTGDESVFMNGDVVRLQQVITNLLQNAIKFSSANGTVTMSLEKNASSASIRVADNGVGIEPEFLPHIFDRFSQADASTKRSYTGLGLGLTIVRTIVELHGGDISVESEGIGRGSVFKVRLPLSGEAGEKDLDAADQAAVVRTGKLSGKSVLLVDDDADGMKPLQLFLQRHDADVICAMSAAEALEYMAVQDFQILISDIGMPSTDGYELISKIRGSSGGEKSRIAAIALTAYASADDKQKALAAGYQIHLPKPLDYEELLSIIDSVLDDNSNGLAGV